MLKESVHIVSRPREKRHVDCGPVKRWGHPVFSCAANPCPALSIRSAVEDLARSSVSHELTLEFTSPYS